MIYPKKLQIFYKTCEDSYRSMRWHDGLSMELPFSMSARATVTTVTTSSTTKAGIRPIKLIELPIEITDKIGKLILYDFCFKPHCDGSWECIFIRLVNGFNYFLAHPTLQSEYLKKVMAGILCDVQMWTIEGLYSYSPIMSSWCGWEPKRSPTLAVLGGPAPRAADMLAIANLLFDADLRKPADSTITPTQWTADTGRVFAEVLSTKVFPKIIRFKEPGLMPLSPAFQQSLLRSSSARSSQRSSFTDSGSSRRTLRP